MEYTFVLELAFKVGMKATIKYKQSTLRNTYSDSKRHCPPSHANTAPRTKLNDD